MRKYLLGFALLASCTTHRASSNHEKTENPPSSKQVQAEGAQLGAFPSGATYKVPEGFTGHTHENYVRIENASRGIQLFLFESKELNFHKAVEQSWEIAMPGKAIDLESTTEIFEDGYDRAILCNYKNTTIITQATAKNKGEHTWIFLIQGKLEEIQGQNEAISGFLKSFKAPGVVETNLLGKEFKSIKQRSHELDEFVSKAMKKVNTPGLSLAIVENGKISYLKGYGVRKIGTHEYVDENTLFPIGSTTKSLTALLMAKMIDQGSFHWDSPAKSVFENFKVADGKLSESLTLEQLICNCSGFASRDLSLMMTKDEGTKKIFHDLSLLEQKFPFSEKKFNYNNLFFAAAGYIISNRGKKEATIESYYNAMKEQIFLPLKMPRTTANIEEAFSDKNMSPGYENIKGHYVPLLKGSRKFLTLVSPAGSVFSSAKEMAKYLELEINNGITEDGQRFVSEANLLHRRIPQTDFFGGPDQYAFGWVVGKHLGLEKVNHPGDGQGSGTEFLFFPEKKLGITILANANGRDVHDAIIMKIIELWFDAKVGAEITLDSLSSEVGLYEHLEHAELEEPIFEGGSGFPLSIEQKAILDHLIGSYHNSFIGQLHITKRKDKYVLDNGGGLSYGIRSTTKDSGGNFCFFCVGEMFKISGANFSLAIPRDLYEYVFTPDSTGKSDL